ncbi:MAG: RNA polymerase sigma factor [Armatimonadota bacterium]
MDARRGPTDAELVARVAAGEGEALDLLHGRYYARLYRLAYVKLGGREDASDIASETFVRAVKHIAELHPLQTDSLYPWLHTVACNLVTDALRRKRLRPQLSLDDRCREEVAAYIDQAPNGRPRPDEVLERREVQAYVREAIADLPEAQGAAVLYRFVGEMSIREIAEEMGKSEGAVKSLLHRAMNGLRRALTGTPAARGLRRRQVVQPSSRGETDVGGDSVQVHR